MKLSATLILFGIINFVTAQNQLSYNSFLQSIKNNYPLMNQANNVGTIGRIKLQSARGNYDPFLTSSYDNKFYNGSEYFSIFDAKIKQPIYTSQYITAGYQFAQGAYLNPQNTLPPNGMPFIGIEASLLQGLMIDKRRADVLKGAGYKDYYEAEKNIITNEILYTASLTYADWIYSCKELSIYNFFSKQAYNRFLAIKTLSEVGEFATMDSIEANILYQSRNLEKQSIEIENTKRISEINRFIWGSNGETPLFSNNISPYDSIEEFYAKLKIKYYSFINDSLNTNPIIDKYVAYQKILTIDKKYKAELIKPKLDISYNFLSNNITGFENSFSTNNYKWGVYFSVPLFLRTSRNDLKIATININNNLLELSNKNAELTIKADALKINIDIILEQLNNAEKNVYYSKLLLNAEKEKFSNGESSLFLVNTRETKLMESELKLAQFKMKFIKSILELEYIHGNMSYGE